jgi:tripartite-type tricarboxylate transporter receptor subunit TctC
MRVGRCALAVLLALLAQLAAAQERYPTLAIELIVPFGPGGADDAMARKLAPLLQRDLATPVFVTNVAGPSGNAGLTKLLVNPADGYTVAVLSSSTIAAWVLDVGYARLEDFTVLGLVQESTSMLFIPATSPARTSQEFLDSVKANPTRLRVATSGAGTTDDVVLRLLGARGYQTVGAPFSKPLERYAAVAEQRVHAIFEETGHAQTFLRSQHWRPLVVVDEVRHPQFPEVPCVSELGVSAGNFRNFRLLVVGAKTPPERVRLLADVIARSLLTADWKSYCESTWSCSSPWSAQEAAVRARQLYRDVESKFPKGTATQGTTTQGPQK